MTLDNNINRWIKELNKIVKEIKNNLTENKDIRHLKFMKSLEYSFTHLQNAKYYLKKFE